jgi:predicted nucleic acid-binding protein
VSQSYVLDTNILLTLLRGKELGERIDRAFGLRAAPYLHTVSIVTHAELRVLADRNQWGDTKQAAVTKALDEFVTVNISGGAIVAAYRRVEAGSVGINMGKNDIWIAATAMIAGLPLVTTDNDFSHLNGKLLQVFYVDPRARDPFELESS